MTVTRYRDWLLARGVWCALSGVVFGAVVAAVSAVSGGQVMDPLWFLPIMIAVTATIWAAIIYRSDRDGERRALEAPEPLAAGAEVVSPWPRALATVRRRLPWGLLLVVLAVAADALFGGDSVAWVIVSLGLGEAIADAIWLRRRADRVEREQGRELYIVAGAGTIAWAPAAPASGVPSPA